MKNARRGEGVAVYCHQTIRMTLSLLLYADFSFQIPNLPPSFLYLVRTMHVSSHPVRPFVMAAWPRPMDNPQQCHIMNPFPSRPPNPVDRANQIIDGALGVETRLALNVYTPCRAIYYSVLRESVVNGGHLHAA